MMSLRTRFRWVFPVVLLLALVGCGEDGDGVSSATGGATTSTSVTGRISLVMTDTSTGAETTLLSSAAPVTVTATVFDDSVSPSVVIPNALVTFSTNSMYGVLVPSSGTARTNALGQASVLLQAAGNSLEGASEVTASIVIGDETITVSHGYAVGTPNVAVSAPVFGTTSLSAFGTTSIVVKVTDRATNIGLVGQAVRFSSPCATSGKAVLPEAALLTNALGEVMASYADKGCGSNDTVTATAGDRVSNFATLTVLSPDAGSVQFVSSTPSYITLKGTGGVGRQETSTVRFRVVDIGDRPVAGKLVSFALSTAVGGLAITPSSAWTDDRGEVTTVVQAGTVAGPVRVLATVAGAGGAVLSTQSDGLWVSTGIPDQDSVSLGTDKLSVEGWNRNGEEISVTIQLGDHFNNPVPDGTAVYFTAEGGSVEPGCFVSAGACSVKWISQNPRPSDGRVTITAYAIGEESFIDLNGNGKADTGEYVNIGEVFRDDNENGVRDATETFVDFNGDGIYNGSSGVSADVLYNGLLCNSSCSTDPSVYVWRYTVVTMASSSAVVTTDPSITSINLNVGTGGFPGCRTEQVSYSFDVADKNGNRMPPGTVVEVTTTNGSLVGESSFKVEDSIEPPDTFQVSLASDGVLVRDSTGTATGCDDSTGSGVLTIKVTTPFGEETTKKVTVNN